MKTRKTLCLWVVVSLIATLAIAQDSTKKNGIQEKGIEAAPSLPSVTLLQIRITDDRKSELQTGRLLVTLSAKSGQKLWDATIPARNPLAGTSFYITSEDLPILTDITGMTLQAEVPGHIPASATIAVSTENGSYTLRPNTVAFALRAASPWLTLLLILPALIGLPVTISRVNHHSRCARTP